jgi:alkaline phosphatase D
MEILRKHSPAPGLFSRRGFLTCAGATLLQTALADHGLSRSAPAQGLGGNPFTLGVASGDPLPHGIVLWTRLAPDPLNGGGVPQHPIPVQWEIALDEHLERVVQRGFARALPELAHSVHVEVDGLQPACWYWYRFRAGNEVSPIGRTRTAPPFGAALDELQFAFVSCQHYGNGYYPALRRMAEEDLEFAVHLGDYIYEGASNGTPRTHLPAREIVTIDDYRIRHAQYRSDPDLQAVHAAFPWIMTWDDHEVENDYAGFLPENPADPADNQPDFATRRARAYQAYYEHMPLRRTQLPTGPYLQLYRRLSFGNLVQVNVLDTRQYRSHRAPASCDLSQRVNGYCPEALDPTRTIEGVAQRNWLLNGLGRSIASWNLLANQVPFAPSDGNASPDIVTFGNEKWDGYPVDRQQVLDFLRERNLVNTIIITGDNHNNWVRNVPPDYLRLDAEPVATEFIGTSVSTGGDRTINTTYGGDVNNPHFRFFDNHHGYVRCKLTPELWTTDFRTVPTVLSPDAPISTLASFVVEQGRAGAQLNSSV